MTPQSGSSVLDMEVSQNGTGPTKLHGRGLSPGKIARLYRMLYEHGPGNGKALFLPIDQGLEHGPRDFFENPQAGQASYQFKLAKEGNFSAVALHIGLAEKYYWEYAGEVPLLLKINGKTEIPSDKQAFSPLTARVEDAVRLGADAVGYTLYVGSPSQERDIAQLMEVRRDCERFGMPLVVWAYPRGEAVDSKGGKNSLYAIDYAARVALECGADLVKLNIPNPNAKEGAHKDYTSLNDTQEEAIKRVVTSAGRAMVIISGGDKVDDETLYERAEQCANAGAIGYIYGRNLWQRPLDDALTMAGRLSEILRKAG